MTLRSETFEIVDADEVDPILALMGECAANGRGWINVQARIAADAAPPNRSALTRYFRRNSPDAALATWMPSTPDGSDGRQSLGVQHALGARISPLLTEWGIPPAEAWRRLQDSPRHGLLLSVPTDEAHGPILRWMLQVTVAATTRRTDGTWQVTWFPGRAA